MEETPETPVQVKYNATIKPRFEEPQETPLPAQETPPPPTPLATEINAQDLITLVLVGVGCAYAIGLITGRFIFSAPSGDTWVSVPMPSQ